MYFKVRFESDPKRKKRIEQSLLLLYQTNIDNLLLSDKILLPPPNKDDAKGEYELGNVIYDDKEICQFGLRKKEFLRHIGIFGITGTGKSNTVFKLIEEFIKHDTSFFLFDWKKQYRDYLSLKPDADVLIFGVGNPNIPTFQFNPLIPPKGLEPIQYVEHIAHIVASSYYCGEGVITLLRRALTKLYNKMTDKYPTFQDVLEEVKRADNKSRSRDWKESAIRAIEAICHGGLGEIVNVQKPTLTMSELLNRNVFLELGDLGQSQKMFIIQSMLVYLYYYAMNRGVKEKFTNSIIIEEAHHILRDSSQRTREPISDIILKEIREFGFGVVIVDQNPSLISVPALGNNYTTIGQYVKHASDISALSKAMFLTEEQKKMLGKLRCGQGIIKLAGRIFSPFLVQFPLVPIKKGTIADSHVAQHMFKKGFVIPIKTTCIQANSSGVSSNHTPLAESTSNQATSKTDEKNKVKEVNKGSKDLGMKLRTALVRDIDLHPFDGISTRFKRLKCSQRKGRVAIDELMESNIINRVETSTKSGKIVLLEIDKVARKLMIEKGANIKPMLSYHGGVIHRYWNHIIAKINKSNDYEVQLEAKLPCGGYVDQIATGRGIRIAIEIETGKSKPIDTIKRDLKAGFDKVVCVCTTKEVSDNISKEINDRRLVVLNVKDYKVISLYKSKNFQYFVPT